MTSTRQHQRLLLLLLLLLLALLVPTVLKQLATADDLRWQTMVQPHWDERDEPLALQPAGNDDDAEEEFVDPGEPLRPPRPVDIPAPEPPAATRESPATAVTATEPVQASKPPAKPAATAKPAHTGKPAPTAEPKAPAAHSRNLKLKLPENPYQHHPARWEDKPPLPDLFAPKPAEPSRYEFSGRLITDDKKQKDPQASFLDSIQGAEVNISVKTP